MQTRKLNECIKCSYQWLSVEPKRCAMCNTLNWQKKEPEKKKDDEKFVQIKNVPHYQISNYGRIFSDRGGVFLSNRTLKVVLYGKSFSITILMVSSFDPDNYYGQRIYYRNGDKHDIRMSNVDY